MVPVFDTDVAEERWQSKSWESYELWEKIELRERRKRRLWILTATILFLILASIPVVQERRWKWGAQGVARELAREVGSLKRQAAIEHVAFRLRFGQDGSLAYRVERVESCADAAVPQVVREGTLGGARSADFRLLNPKEASNFGIPGVVTEVCFDPLVGKVSASHEDTIGFGVLPAKDLTAERTDRLSLLLLGGPSAEMSFD